MGMGLDTAYGAQGAADALRQIIKDRLEQQQRERDAAQQQFTNSRLMANDARVAEEHAANMRSLGDQRASTQQAAQEGEAAKGVAGLSIDQSIPAPMMQRLRGTMQTANIAENPPLAQPPVDGMMQPDIVPGQQPGAVWKGTDAQRTGEEQKQLRGRLMSNPDLTDRERLMINMEGAGLKVPAGMEAKPAPTHLVQAVKGGKPTFVPEGDAAGMTPYHPPSAAASGDKLTKVEHKDPATGRTVIEWLPQSEIRGKTFQKGTGAAAEQRLASAEAVNQTGDDIVAQLSSPAVKQSLGPALGRFVKLSDFIGNPPPEYAELAGQIESYALASMGVHGMRSAQGAAQIKAMLDAHHTPESLAAAIHGLSKFSQHYMANEGRTAQPAGGGVTGGAKMTAEELIKKYGGD